MRVPVVYMRQVALSGAGGFADELRGASELGDPEYQVQVRRLWPFGIRSVPPAGVDAVAVGTSMSGLAMVGAESARYGPSDLADGETALYSASSESVRLTAAGQVLIGTAAAEAALLGTSFVAALNTFLTALSTYASAIQLIADPVGTATATLATAIATMQTAATAAKSAVVKVK